MKRKTIQQIICAVFILMFSSSIQAQNSTRQTIDLCDSWTFYPAYNVSQGVKKTKVTLPHTWNAYEGLQGQLQSRGNGV